MNERIPAQRERPLGSGGGGTHFDEASDIPATVNVSSGPYREDLPAGNLSVGEIRRRFGDRFDLDPHSQAVVDGHAVADDVVVRPGQALMFTRQAGEKGAGGIPMNWSAGFQHGAIGAKQHAVLEAGAPSQKCTMVSLSLTLSAAFVDGPLKCCAFRQSVRRSERQSVPGTRSWDRL